MEIERSVLVFKLNQSVNNLENIFEVHHQRNHYKMKFVSPLSLVYVSGSMATEGNVRAGTLMSN